MIAKNDERKRNILWRVTMSVSSVLVILIAAFFLIKMFTGNPMEGKWANEDSDLVMEVKGNGTAVIQWPEEFDGAEVAVRMQYSIDKESKIFSLHVDEAEVKDVVENSKGAVTTNSLDSAMGYLEGSYDYNIERNQLTLTEREYGEQMVFAKK